MARIDSAGDVDLYLTDMVGSVRQIADTDGTILDGIDYDTYAAILNETVATEGDRFKYSGQEWDEEIGLQYNRARYYDSTTGRWISEDPVREESSDDNLYRYVLNNPTVYVDPYGADAMGGLGGLVGGGRCGWGSRGEKVILHLR